MKKLILLMAVLTGLTSCSTTQFNLKNTDDNAPNLTLSDANTFLITAYSQDKRYGYEREYPINIFFNDTKNDTINQTRFLSALAGPEGEEITYIKSESCCPFPTKKSELGAGFLDVYQLNWKGQKKPVTLYLNIYEKGLLLVPVGLSVKK